jgi:putative Mn2+ efflux pump MntP
MQVNILTACLIIGGITTVVATIGVMLGSTRDGISAAMQRCWAG